MANIKKERFMKIAEKRTNNIINTLRLLGNCSNRNNYDYNNEQVRQIFAVIENELKVTKMKYKENEQKFVLKG